MWLDSDPSMTKLCTCWCHVTIHLIISNDKGPQHRKTEIATHPWQRTNKQSCEVDTYYLQGLCYVTVGTFAWCGLGSAKQQHWVVCSEFCLSTKSKEDLDGFWWWVVNLQRNKSSCMKNNCERVQVWEREDLRSIGFYQSTVVQQKKSSLGLQATQYAWLIYLGKTIRNINNSVMIPTYKQTIFSFPFVLFSSPPLLPFWTIACWLTSDDSYSTTMTHPRTPVLGPEGCMMTHRLTLWLTFVYARML